MRSITASESFTDGPIRPGVTPVRALHFMELRTRIDALRRAGGLQVFPWTDPVLTAGVTRVRLTHLLELREALARAYARGGPFGAGLDRRRADGGGDHDQGGTSDGAARGGARARVSVTLIRFHEQTGRHAVECELV